MAFRAPCARQRGGFRPHPSPKVLSAGVVDFVGVVDVVEGPEFGEWFPPVAALDEPTKSATATPPPPEGARGPCER